MGTVSFDFCTVYDNTSVWKYLLEREWHCIIDFSARWPYAYAAQHEVQIIYPSCYKATDGRHRYFKFVSQTLLVVIASSDLV